MSELYAIEKSTLEGIGSAIKGVKDLNREVYVSQFKNEIESIATFHIDGSKVLESKSFDMETFNIYRGPLPADITFKTCAEIKGTVYVIGTDSKDRDCLYRLDDGSWTLLYQANLYDATKSIDIQGNAAVFNDEIYVLHKYSNMTLELHKWNGTTWVRVATLPTKDSTNCSVGAVLVTYDGALHILGACLSTDLSNAHYKWNGSNIVNVSQLPIRIKNNSLTKVIVCNGELHVIGNTDNVNTYGHSHYKWNGATWTSVSTSPLPSDGSGVAVVDGELYMFRRFFADDANTRVYKWDGNAWTQLYDLNFTFYGGMYMTIDNSIHLLGLYNNPSYIILGAKRYKEVFA